MVLGVRGLANLQIRIPKAVPHMEPQLLKQNLGFLKANHIGTYYSVSQNWENPKPQL